MTQKQLILNYMQDFGSISPAEAFVDLGITKLATGISELQRVGVQVEKRWESRPNRYGKKSTYRRYNLKKAEQRETTE